MHQRIEYDILELAISIVNVFLNGSRLLDSSNPPTDLRPPPCHVNHDGISVTNNYKYVSSGHVHNLVISLFMICHRIV